VFVGRSYDLAVVHSAAEESRGGRPWVVAVEGQAGIGKTAFLAQATGQLTGFSVFSTGADEDEQEYEYATISRLTSALAKYLPSSLTILPGKSPFAVGIELLTCLGDAQADGPVALVIDDLHWVDRQSAEALAILVRRLRTDRVLVLVSTRPVPEAERGAWARLLADQQRTRRIRLTGLSVEEVGVLAGGVLGGTALSRAATERLHDHTGGHPLHLRALLTEVPREAWVWSEAQLPAPRSLADSVRAQLAALAPPSRDLAGALAILTGAVPLALAGAVARVDDPSSALEPLLRTGVATWRPDQADPAATIAHPLIRAAIVDGLAPTTARRLNAGAALALGPVAGMRHRVAAADRFDPVLVADLQRLAQEAAARGEDRTAGTYLGWAADLADDLTAKDMLRLRSALYYLFSGGALLVEHRRPELEATADGPLRDVVLGMLHLQSGRAEAAERLLRRAVERLEESADAELRGVAAAELSMLYVYRSQGPEAVEAADTALAADVRDPRTRNRAAVTKAFGQAHIGRVGAGLAALDFVPADPADTLPTLVDALFARGMLRDYAGRLGEAAADLTAAIRMARAGAALGFLPRAHFHLATVQWFLGAWDDAIINAEHAVTLATEEDRRWDLALAFGVAARPLGARGEFQTAQRYLDEGWRCAREVHAPQAIAHTAGASAEVARSHGDYQAMLTAMSAIFDTNVGGRILPVGNERARAFYVEALIGTGRLDDAAIALTELADRLPDKPIWLHPVAGWLRGWLAASRGDVAAALHAYREALAMRCPDQTPLYRGLLEHWYGRLLRATGERRPAIDMLRSAYDRFAALGAKPFAERCAADLAAAGLPPQRRTGRDILALTAREQDVARLAARGLTTREIAAELYVSGKAVEYHLGNIYAKLGLNSRRQLRHVIR
jgi:ATP/maltotriose-dependent transcriptional regulator MalT